MLTEHWKNEYTRKGIPSSFRTDPTRVVTNFLSFVKEKNLNQGLAADLGCGKGRNSFYLAENGFSVVALDWLEENVNEVNLKSKEARLPIRAHSQCISEAWPILPFSLDIAIDIFCYKHLVCKEKQRHYRKHLYRSLKSDGYYLISLASKSDGFYGPLIEYSASPEMGLIVDPFSQIPSFLYTLDTITQEFSDLFKVVDIKEDESLSPMYGKEYKRSVITAIFQRKPNVIP